MTHHPRTHNTEHLFFFSEVPTRSPLTGTAVYVLISGNVAVSVNEAVRADDDEDDDDDEYAAAGEADSFRR